MQVQCNNFEHEVPEKRILHPALKSQISNEKLEMLAKS